jgi:dolichol-phosphate mannosyltransferase
MISKYTIVLLIPAIFLYLLISRSHRHWLLDRRPYLAVLLALILFMPVIIWNYQNGWASFIFQTARRVGMTSHFSLHLLLGSILILITPIGFLAAIYQIGLRNRTGSQTVAEIGRLKDFRLFSIIMALVPLLIFAVFSLSKEPKLNWTGPAWLALLPLIAQTISWPREDQAIGTLRVIRTGWKPTFIILLLLYGGGLYYLAVGFPGISYPKEVSKIAGWRNLGRQVGVIQKKMAEETGSQPLVVGMDKYNIASELAFYNRFGGSKGTAGSHLFGFESLMYHYWFPVKDQAGKIMILLARSPDGLERSSMNLRFGEMAPTEKISIHLNGRDIGFFYYRVGYGYNPIE